jgi:hypothetical protein
MARDPHPKPCSARAQPATGPQLHLDLRLDLRPDALACHLHPPSLLSASAGLCGVYLYIHIYIYSLYLARNCRIMMMIVRAKMLHFYQYIYIYISCGSGALVPTSLAYKHSRSWAILGSICLLQGLLKAPYKASLKNLSRSSQVRPLGIPKISCQVSSGSSQGFPSVQYIGSLASPLLPSCMSP